MLLQSETRATITKEKKIQTNQTYVLGNNSKTKIHDQL